MRLYWLSAAAAATTTTASRTAFLCRNSRRTFRFAKNTVAKMSSSSAKSTSLPPLVDVDCNLWHSDLKSLQRKEGVDDLATQMREILKEDAVQESNIVAMMSPSSTIDEAENGMKVLSEDGFGLPIKTTVGVHPYHVNDEGLGSLEPKHVERMKALLESNRALVCAVGECGLDTSDGFPPLSDQIPWFHAQVELAEKLQLPIFLHERFAFEETMKALQGINVPVIVHCFTGTREECKEYVSKGYSLSVSGFICKGGEGPEEVRACLEEGLIPLDKLMIETDAPYMGFEDCRSMYVEKNADFVAGLNSKKRKRLINSIYPNVPSCLPKVVDQVVESLNVGRASRNEPPYEREEVANQMTQNSISFFNFSI